MRYHIQSVLFNTVLFCLLFLNTTTSNANDSTNDNMKPFSSFADFDNDGIEDSEDNCLYYPNPEQLDSDNDGIGDACDGCPNNPEQQDNDGDSIPDICDNCPNKNIF